MSAIYGWLRAPERRSADLRPSGGRPAVREAMSAGAAKAALERLPGTIIVLDGVALVAELVVVLP